MSEKIKSKIVEDVKSCIFEGREMDDCLKEAQKKYDLEEKETEVIRWEVSKGQKRK